MVECCYGPHRTLHQYKTYLDFALTTVPQPIEYTAHSKNRICDLAVSLARHLKMNKLRYGPNQDTLA